MKIKQNLLVSGIFLASNLLVNFPTFAQSSSCSITILTPVSFGSYDVFSGSATPGIGQIGYKCNGNAIVSLSTGNASSYNPRQMRNTRNESLNYNLYTDLGSEVIWGDGTGGTQTQAIPATSKSISIFGSIPPKQNVRAGSYTDNITITINF